jgi:hypothetical protein
MVSGVSQAQSTRRSYRVRERFVIFYCGRFCGQQHASSRATSACKSSLVNTIFAMSNTLQQQDFSVQKPESTRDSTPILVQTCTLGPLLVAADVTSISTDFSEYRAQTLGISICYRIGKFPEFPTCSRNGGAKARPRTSKRAPRRIRRIPEFPRISRSPPRIAGDGRKVILATPDAPL